MVNALVDLRQDRGYAQQSFVLARTVLGALEDFRLGLIQQLAYFFAGRGKRTLRDFGGNLPEAALYRAITYQLSVTPDVDCARRVLCECSQVRRTASLVLVLAART